MPIKRGDIFWVDLDPVKGSEQGGRRPVVVLQNDIGNAYAPTTIVSPLTTKIMTKEYPTNVSIPAGHFGLKAGSTILLSQVRVVDRLRLNAKIGHLSEKYMEKVNAALKVSLGL